jgi:hypothetical protein
MRCRLRRERRSARCPRHISALAPGVGRRRAKGHEFVGPPGLRNRRWIPPERADADALDAYFHDPDKLYRLCLASGWNCRGDNLKLGEPILPACRVA